MKRIIKTLIFALVLMPVVALADIGMPEPSIMKAKITNKDGVYLVDSDGKKTKTKYEYGEEVEVAYISKDCAMVYDSYNESGCISPEDLTPLLDLEEYTFRKQSYNLYAYEDTKVYEYPIFSSKEVGTIKKGEKFENYYVSTDEGYNDPNYSNWKYVMHNGVNGWVYAVIGGQADYYNDKEVVSSVAKVEKLEIYIANSKTKLYEKPYYDSKEVSASLKIGDKLTSEYLYDCYPTKYAYVKVGSSEGWIQLSEVAMESESDLFVYDAKYVKLYEEPTYEMDPVDVKLETGKIYKSKYSVLNFKDEGYYSVEVDGKNYWISTPQWEYGVTDGYTYWFNKIKINNDLDYYSDIELTNKLGTLEGGKDYFFIPARVWTDDVDIIFVKDLGYVPIDEFSVDWDNYYDFNGNLIQFKVNDNNEKDPIVEIKNTSTGEVVATEVETTKAKETKETKKLDDNLVLYIIIGAVVLTLTTIVIIIIIKRKKKKNIVAATTPAPVENTVAPVVQVPVENNITTDDTTNNNI